MSPKCTGQSNCPHPIVTSIVLCGDQVPLEGLKDYRMTRVTFGVSASSFAANMCMKQNAIDNANKFLLAAKAIEESFYVDDSLTGADSA